MVLAASLEFEKGHNPEIVVSIFYTPKEKNDDLLPPLGNGHIIIRYI